ncbi:MAG TPA: IclR family transcriptional regulator [Paraburkholderia sp.]
MKNRGDAAKPEKPKSRTSAEALTVRSVEKAFNVLEAFGSSPTPLSLTALAATLGVDKSTAQRFTYTLERLGYLHKDPETKRLSLTVKALNFSYGYLRTNDLLTRAMPYLIHLSRETEETINITVRDDTEIVFVSRFMSRHLFNTDVTVGTRMPVYCTAPGIAMLAQLPRAEALDVLRRCDRRPITQETTWQLEALDKKLDQTAARGYATAFEEYYHDDLSISAPLFDARHMPGAALTLSVSRSRYTPNEAQERFAPQVVAAARAISQSGHGMPGQGSRRG